MLPSPTATEAATEAGGIEAVGADRAGRLPAALDQVDCWLFDMDNTLYPSSANLFRQIDVRMRAYVGRLLGLPEDEARLVQKRLFREHGTTLRGLMDAYHVNPNGFLAEVHDIDMSVLDRDFRLRNALRRLPGRRIVFTNADQPYAERVLEALGIADCFDAIHDIHAMDYRPKPDPACYRQLLDAHAIAAERAFFADDMALNLAPASRLGMRTGWVNNGSERGDEGHVAEHIDFELTNLTDWLEELTR